MRQEACASVKDQLHEQGDGKAAASSAAPELPQLRGLCGFPAPFPAHFCHQRPPTPLVAWPHTPPQMSLSEEFL